MFVIDTDILLENIHKKNVYQLSGKRKEKILQQRHIYTSPVSHPHTYTYIH